MPTLPSAFSDEADPGTVTVLLLQAEAGEAGAWDALFSLVYPYLRNAAARALERERGDHTLQPTDLLHEAYMRLVHQDKATARNRAHFFGICGRCMRQILVDHARARNAQKRGGDVQILSLDARIDVPEVAKPEYVLLLDEAVERLEQIDEPRARLVEMRLFAGLTLEEAAVALNTTYSTARRRWEAARLWLQDYLERAA
ncbi:MAG: ECF-type sigma factor [Rhodothermales bacterium]